MTSKEALVRRAIIPVKDVLEDFLRKAAGNLFMQEFFLIILVRGPLI